MLGRNYPLQQSLLGIYPCRRGSAPHATTHSHSHRPHTAAEFHLAVMRSAGFRSRRRPCGPSENSVGLPFAPRCRLSRASALGSVGFLGGGTGSPEGRTELRHAVRACGGVCVRASCATPFLLNFRSRCNNYYFLVDFAADVVLAFFCSCCAVSRSLSFAHLWRPSRSHLCLRRGAHAWRMHLLSHVGVRMSGCAFPACVSVCVCASNVTATIAITTKYGVGAAANRWQATFRLPILECLIRAAADLPRPLAAYKSRPLDTMDGGVCGSTPEIHRSEDAAHSRTGR